MPYRAWNFQFHQPNIKNAPNPSGQGCFNLSGNQSKAFFLPQIQFHGIACLKLNIIAISLFVSGRLFQSPRHSECPTTIKLPLIPIVRPYPSIARPHISIARPHTSIARPHISIARPHISIARPHASIARLHASIARPHISIARHENDIEAAQHDIEAVHASIARLQDYIEQSLFAIFNPAQQNVGFSNPVRYKVAKSLEIAPTKYTKPHLSQAKIHNTLLQNQASLAGQ